MITNEIYTHVLPAVQLIIADLNGQLDPAQIDQQVYTRLWPYVTHAVREARPTTGMPPTPDVPDRRAKTWQIVVRFWAVTPIDTQLIAETDPELIVGTGKLPALLAAYGLDMHGVDVPELSELVIKAMLPQLRNNLGRQGKAVLRIEYSVGDDPFLCHVDVTKP